MTRPSATKATSRDEALKEAWKDVDHVVVCKLDFDYGFNEGWDACVALMRKLEEENDRIIEEEDERLSRHMNNGDTEP